MASTVKSLFAPGGEVGLRCRKRMVYGSTRYHEEREKSRWRTVDVYKKYEGMPSAERSLIHHKAAQKEGTVV